VTSTYVLDESFTLIRMRVSHPAAVRFGEGLSKSAWCRAIDVLEDTRDAAWEIFVRYEDQLFSFTDCTSFALMHSMKLDEAFTYDKKDFGAAGFTPVPT
jgi:predicted nucleic acid-binding protein